MSDNKQKAMLGAQLRRLGWFTLVAVVVLAGLGIFSRSRSETRLSSWTAAQAVPNVRLISPTHGVDGQELVLPGEIEANYEAPIHARTGGYLKMWKHDIGAHVNAGELLAEIDTPDLDEQLLQARAALDSARADAQLADLTARRFKASVVANAVSQQAIDEKAGVAQARKAQVAAAEANVRRLTVLEGFKRVVAPFDGVVITRKTDVGALIVASGDSGSELFRVADLHSVRIYVHVPQAFAGALTAGMKVVLKLPQHPDQSIAATLATTSNAIDHGSRTMLAEFNAENPDGKLWPGTFIEAHLQIPADPKVLQVPSSTLMFRKEGLRVAVLGQNGKAQLKPVTLGRDTGARVEILSGIIDSDRIIDSPPASLADGDSVRTDTPQS